MFWKWAIWSVAKSLWKTTFCLFEIKKTTLCTIKMITFAIKLNDVFFPIFFKFDRKLFMKISELNPQSPWKFRQRVFLFPKDDGHVLKIFWNSIFRESNPKSSHFQINSPVNLFSSIKHKTLLRSSKKKKIIKARWFIVWGSFDFVSKSWKFQIKFLRSLELLVQISFTLCWDFFAWKKKKYQSQENSENFERIFQLKNILFLQIFGLIKIWLI